MSKEKEETKEAVQLIKTLKDLRTLFKKDIRAYLIVTSRGIIISAVQSLNELEDVETENDTLGPQIKFTDKVIDRSNAAILQDTNYIS